MTTCRYLASAQLAPSFFVSHTLALVKVALSPAPRWGTSASHILFFKSPPIIHLSYSQTTVSYRVQGYSPVISLGKNWAVSRNEKGSDLPQLPRDKSVLCEGKRQGQ